MMFDLSIPPMRTWSFDNAAVFCRVAEENGEHSNLNRHFPYEDCGLHWLGTEAQYQAMRFPHLPDHQEAIRSAPSLMAAKLVAYERIDETRTDWPDIMMPAMAYVLTRKIETRNYSSLLAATGDRPIIELSVKDDFWGAKPRAGKLHGRNALGVLIQQLRAGARMYQLPPNTTFQKPAAAVQAPVIEPAQLGFGGFDTFARSPSRFSR